MLSATTTFPLACFLQLFIRYVGVCFLYVCVSDVLACMMSGWEPVHISCDIHST
jgi:hypothetical protein